MNINNFYKFSIHLFFIFIFSFSFTSALISNGANHNGVLGQYDTVNTPVFTKNGANDGPNDYGFDNPQFSAYDTVNNRIFVSDVSNNRVLVYNTDASGVPLDYLADFVLGQPDLISNNTGLTSSSFEGPTSLTYDETTLKLYVADSLNNRILIFNLSGGITNGMAAANVLGQTDFITNTSGLSSSKFNFLAQAGITLDTAGQRLFVAESLSNRVLVFNVSVITDGMAATNVIGQSLFTTNTLAVTSAGMSGPNGVAYDANNDRLFVSQCNANRITSYDTSSIADGMAASNVIGQSDFITTTTGASASKIRCPVAVVYDNVANRLFAVGQVFERVLVYDGSAIADGMSATNILGQTSFAANIEGVAQSNFSSGIMGLAYHSVSQNLMVADPAANRFLTFDVNAITNGENAVNILGQYNAAITAPDYTKFRVNGSTSPNGFEFPASVAIDSVRHRLFVVDQSNRRVLVYNLTTGNLLASTTPANVIGQVGFYSNVNAGITDSSFSNVTFLTYDSANDRLFITDTGNHRVLVFNTAIVTDGMSASFVIGQTDFITNSGGGTTATKFVSPQGTYYDNISGKLFVADTSNRRVLVFNAGPGILANGPTATTVLGQANFTSNAASLSASGFSSPRGVAYDATHDRLYVSDAVYHRVTIFNGPLTNNMNASNVWGQADFTTSTFGLGANKFNQPRHLDYDATNNRLLVADGNNSRVLVFDATTITNNQNAANVIGQPDFTTITAAASISKLDFAQHAVFDNLSGNIFIADSANNRVITNDGSVVASPITPVIVGVSPTLGSGFSTTSTASIFFNTAVATTTGGTFTFRDYFTGNTVATLGTNSPVFSMGTTSLQITPYPVLPLGMRLYLEIASSTLTNVASTTVFAGLTGSSTVYFDTPGSFTFSSSSINISESAGTVNIPYHWYYTGSGSGQVDYSVSGGTATGASDYTSIPTTVITKTGVTDLTGTISLSILNDLLTESTETIVLSFSNPMLFAALGATTSVTINILDDDTVIPSGGGGGGGGSVSSGGGGYYVPADQTFTPVQTSTKDSLASKLLKDFTPEQIKNLTPEQINLKYFGADKDGHSTLGLQNCQAGEAARAKYNTKISPSKIEEIQLFLNSQGEKLRVTGLFHLDDVAAVKRFQNKYGLKETGEWNYSEHDIASSIACGFQLKKINFDNLFPATSTKNLSQKNDRCNIFDTVLKKGAKNPKSKVMDLQEFLNLEIKSKLPVSGFFGGQTEAAVKSYQKKYIEFILTSQSFKSPTGIFHKKSIEKANQIICQKN